MSSRCLPLFIFFKVSFKYCKQILCKIIYVISLIFYKDAYLVCAYIVIPRDAKIFSSGTLLPLLYTSVKPSC